MAHIHIAATPGVTIDGFRAVAAKHNPPQDIDGLLAWAAGTDSSGLHVVTVGVQGAPGPVVRRAALPRVPGARHDRRDVEHGVHRIRRGRTVHPLSAGPGCRVAPWHRAAKIPRPPVHPAAGNPSPDITRPRRTCPG
jgi:hypothetical protein